MLREARRSSDRWLRLAAETHAAPDPASRTEEIRIMERLLALRNVPLFGHLSLEQLEAIGQFMNEAQYLRGELVVREGEIGEDLFVILEGEVDCFKNHGAPDQIHLSTLRAPGYFGEISILDNAPRSATVLVTQDARLATLAGERFRELVLQSPEIAFDMLQVQTSRLRSAEERERRRADAEAGAGTGAPA